MKRNTRTLGFLQPIYVILVLVVLLFLWEFLAQRGRIDVIFFSSPSRIAKEFIDMIESGMLKRHLFVTLQEAALGLFYGCFFGSLAGIFLGMKKSISSIVMPLIVGINSIPKLALAPLIIIWFGIGLTSKVLIAAMMVFFIFMFNMFSGYNSVDASLVQTLRLLGANRLQVIRHVVWPSCLPWFLASLRTGMGIALSGAIVGEYIGASRGLGWLINDASGRYHLTQVLCCVFLIIVIMTILDFMVRIAERILLKWRPKA